MEKPLHKTWVLFFLFLSFKAAADSIPVPPFEDRVRLAEAFELANSIQDEIWSDWSTVPFVVLLVTPEFEYLVRHPYPPDDFKNLGIDQITGEEIFARPYSGNFSTGFLATFPAVSGVNTVVIGQPENADKSSTPWVITALHEHFHQLQFTRPWYYTKVDSLDLANGDETGMWQLNYPFPYEEDQVAALIDGYRDALLMGLKSLESGESVDLSVVHEASCKLIEQLASSDGRYLEFQIWQEGIARYTEHAVTRFAMAHHTPLDEFTKLADYMPYSAALESLRTRLRTELETLNVAEWQRTVFYSLGAAHSLLLETGSNNWKERYFEEPFSFGCFATLPRSSG